jgi:hypothetical protein
MKFNLSTTATRVAHEHLASLTDQYKPEQLSDVLSCLERAYIAGYTKGDLDGEREVQIKKIKESIVELGLKEPKTVIPFETITDQELLILQGYLFRNKHCPEERLFLYMVREDDVEFTHGARWVFENAFKNFEMFNGTKWLPFGKEV